MVLKVLPRPAQRHALTASACPCRGCSAQAEAAGARVRRGGDRRALVACALAHAHGNQRGADERRRADHGQRDADTQHAVEPRAAGLVQQRQVGAHVPRAQHARPAGALLGSGLGPAKRSLPAPSATWRVRSADGSLAAPGTSMARASVALQGLWVLSDASHATVEQVG